MEGGRCSHKLIINNFCPWFFDCFCFLIHCSSFFVGFFICLLNFCDMIHEVKFMIRIHEHFGIRNNFVAIVQLRPSFKDCRFCHIFRNCRCFRNQWNVIAACRLGHYGNRNNKTSLFLRIIFISIQGGGSMTMKEVTNKRSCDDKRCCDDDQQWGSGGWRWCPSVKNC